MVEQLLRRAWVQVVQGRQEGRAYLLATGRSRLGLDEHAEVGLFGDPTVARKHAEIQAKGGAYTLVNLDPSGRTSVNGQAVDAPLVLKDGDRIMLGTTGLIFRQR
jgi:pSer/pThr/pTyr-binding forkhead associated (FHA) protein